MAIKWKESIGQNQADDEKGRPAYMKTFKYRWKKGGHEFIGTWDEKGRDELEQDVKNRGGELIEILNEAKNVFGVSDDIFLGDTDSLSSKTEVDSKSENVFNQDSVNQSKSITHSVDEVKLKSVNNNETRTFWHKPLNPWQAFFAFCGLLVSIPIALFLIVSIYSCLGSWLHPNDANFYFNRGLTYSNQGDLTQAIVDYTKAIEINPNYAGAYNNRGNIYFRQTNFGLANSDYSKAIEIDPNNEFAHRNRGNIYFRKGNYDKAIADYTKAIEINPNSAKTYRNRGNVYFSHGNYDKAIIDYDKAIEIDPNYADAYNSKAYTFYRKGDNLEEGMETINKALKMFPNNGIYLSTKAELLYKLGIYHKAYDYIKKGIALEPNQEEIQSDFKMIEKALKDNEQNNSFESTFSSGDVREILFLFKV